MKSADEYLFIKGGGEMGALTGDYDWSSTTVGTPDQWPQSLRTMVNVLLHSKFPMFLFWGEDLIQFYNDAYRPSLGNEGKHPHALGAKGADTWQEIWPVIKPLIDRVRSVGEATWSEDQLIPIYRNGKLEDVYWTFSYSPVPDDEGNIGGVLVTCTETTKTVESIRRLEISQQQTLASFDQSPVAIALIGKGALDFQMANAFYGELVGRTPAEILGKPLLEAIPELKGQGFEQLLNNVIETGEPYIAKEVVAAVVRNGQLGKIYVDLTYQPQKNIFGETEGVLVIATDVTQQVESRKKVEEAEEKSRLAIDSAELGLYEIDYETDNLIPDKRFKELWGVDEKTERPKYAAAIHPDDQELRKKAHEESLSTGKLEYQARIIWPDKSVHWMKITGKVLRNEDGKAIKLIGVVQNIDRQVLAKQHTEAIVAQRTKELEILNESLKKSEERYHLMVEEVQEYAILYLNPEGIVENWNRGAEKIKGYSAEEIIGKSFSNFYTPKDLANNLPMQLLSLAKEKGKATQEGWRVRKDGSFFWASVVITAIHNQGNEVIGYSKVTHDLTEKKKADDDRIANEVALEHKNKELEKMNKELQSFAYISSHDLQEPLRKIQLFSAHILAEEHENLSDTGKDKFRRIQNAAQRMQALINDLLDYSRASTAERKFEIASLTLLTKQVLDDLAEEIKAQDAAVEMKELCEVPVISFQFRQLLYNLISNALKFRKPDTSPVISITSAKGYGKEFAPQKLEGDKMYCRVSIKDNGIGFEPEYNEKIFEVFQRLHGRHEFSGTGIGLAIVKKIAENHGGMITASAVPGEGSQFDVYLPE